MRRRFRTSFLRTESASSTYLVPGSEVVVAVYRQGATVTQTTDVSPTAPTAVSVANLGRIKAGDVLQKGVSGLSLFLCVGISGPTAILLQSTSGGVQTIYESDRLIPTGLLSLYKYTQGATTISNPLTTNVNGDAEFYVDERFIDCVVSGPVTPYVIIDEEGGASDDALNARDFGVKGDGSTDDTAAINNLFIYAMQQNNGIAQLGRVFFPRGTYKLTNGLAPDGGAPGTAGNNIEIYGEPGTVFQAAAGGWGGSDAMFLFTSTAAARTKFYIHDIEFNGGNLGGSGTPDVSGITTYYQQNITIERCVFKNFGVLGTSTTRPLSGLRIGSETGGAPGTRQGCKDLRIVNCEFSDCDRAGIELIDAENVLIENCTFEDCRSGAIIANQNLTTQALKNITIRNFKVKDCGDLIYPSMWFQDTSLLIRYADLVERLVIEDGELIGTAAQDYGIRIGNWIDVHVRNVSFSGAIQSFGLVVVGCDRQAIEECFFTDLTNAAQISALYVGRNSSTTSEQLTIQKCTFNNLGGSCISLANVTRGVISKNLGYKWGTGTIYISFVDISGANSSKIAITDNEIDSDNIARYGINVGPGVVHTSITGNNFFNLNTSNNAIKDPGAAYYLSAFNNRMGGATNYKGWGQVTLDGSGSQVISDPQVLSTSTRIIFSAASAAAAANIAGMYISAVAVGQFTVTHVAVGSQIINYVILN